MKFQTLKAAVLFAGIALTAQASLAATNATLLNGNSVYGVPAQANAASKVIDVTKAAQEINLKCGEVVNFRNGDKSFTWKFDSVGHAAVDLAAIAPAGFAGAGIKVYVERNEGERN